MGAWPREPLAALLIHLLLVAQFTSVRRAAIVLLVRIRIQIQEAGLEPPRAVVESTQRRLRPHRGDTVCYLIPLWVGGWVIRLKGLIDK